mmetsp:Transcript_42531/g.114334  ORF Transcript_42531/g.114334 Transcript_42531/m.114334 type:complete len:239 (-) Transcript_42531:7-723(-)
MYSLPISSCEKKTAGKAKAEHASRSMVMLVRAAWVENVCSLPILEPLDGVSPPTKKDMPSTSSRFERMLPSSVPFTTPICPARRVCTVRIISTALPKVAFSRPPNVSFFSPAASSSVASPRIFASGTMARKLSQNSGMSPQSWKCARQPRGQATSNNEIGSQSKFLRPARFPGGAALGARSPKGDALGVSRSVDDVPLAALLCFTFSASFLVCTRLMVQSGGSGARAQLRPRGRRRPT